MNTPETTTGRPPEIEALIAGIKALRRDGNVIIERLKSAEIGSYEEKTLAMRKFQEGVMWRGQTLHAIDEAYPGASPTPYPHSCDPSSTVIEPQADAAPQNDKEVSELFSSLLAGSKSSSNPDGQFPG